MYAAGVRGATCWDVDVRCVAVESGRSRRCVPMHPITAKRRIACRRRTLSRLVRRGSRRWIDDVIVVAVTRFARVATERGVRDAHMERTRRGAAGLDYARRSPRCSPTPIEARKCMEGPAGPSGWARTHIPSRR